MISVGFFNNKGGVGKTSLVYHLGWAYADLGYRVLLADLDPQANLSAISLPPERLEDLWSLDGGERQTIYGAIHPVQEELGDIQPVHVEELSERLAMVVGDISLSGFEAKLSQAWPTCFEQHAPSFRATSAFYRVLRDAARRWEADIVLIDVGPNLGALNRAAVLSAQWLVVPLGADLFSVQALRNLGPTLASWRTGWTERLTKAPDLPLPSGRMEPAGYVVMQPNLYGGSVTKAYGRWLSRIPAEYASAMQSLAVGSPPASISEDPACLGVLRHYRSLMPLAHDARKPIFHLRAADGALGAHAVAAREAGDEFMQLARTIAARVGLQNDATAAIAP